MSVPEYAKEVWDNEVNIPMETHAVKNIEQSRTIKRLVELSKGRYGHRLSKKRREAVKYLTDPLYYSNDKG